MRRLLSVCALCLLVRPACTQTLIEGDAWILGLVGVGTTAPSARLEVKASSSILNVLQVSGVDGTPFLAVNNLGQIGLSTSPGANLDIGGVGDIGDIGLNLRNGNAGTGTSKYQMLFGLGNDYRHAIRSSHVDSISGNGLDFLIWTPDAGGSSDIASMDALSLVTTSTGASVHVRPFETPDADIEVSNGSATGGGTVHRALEVTPSSRELKSDISYLSQDDEAQAFNEVAGLKHAAFRYKGVKKRGFFWNTKESMRRGLIYEDAPASIRMGGKALSVNERINNAELALKELLRRLEAAQADAARLEGAR